MIIFDFITYIRYTVCLDYPRVIIMWNMMFNPYHQVQWTIMINPDHQVQRRIIMIDLVHLQFLESDLDSLALRRTISLRENDLEQRRLCSQSPQSYSLARSGHGRTPSIALSVSLCRRRLPPAVEENPMMCGHRSRLRLSGWGLNLKKRRGHSVREALAQGRGHGRGRGRAQALCQWPVRVEGQYMFNDRLMICHGYSWTQARAAVAERQKARQRPNTILERA
jgi:hypothetical protein